MINTFLNDIRQNKRNVLIIDDLDRIDPEHIFRILNVFSAHNNQFGETNKFLFDHVIIVCDMENIKRIFFHKYGEGVDFEGYIDKFYSTEVFYFTNNDALNNYIELTFGDNKDNDELEFLTLMLSRLVGKDLLSVRKILKHKFDFSLPNFTLCEQKGLQEDTFYMHSRPTFLGNGNLFYIESNDFVILRFFKLMSIVYGDFNSFIASLQKTKSSKRQFDYSECNRIIFFLGLQLHISSKTGDDLFFEKYYDGGSGQKYLANIGYPTLKILNQKLRINLMWNSGNKYNSDVSYFKNAKVSDVQSITYTNGSSGILIRESDIFDIVEKIAIASHENGYLSKAGIHFQTAI